MPHVSCDTPTAFPIQYVLPTRKKVSLPACHSSAMLMLVTILLLLTCGSSAQQPSPPPLDGAASWLLIDVVSPSSPPSRPPPPNPPPSRPPPFNPPPPTVSVRALFTLEGDAASFDADDVVQFRSDLLARLPLGAAVAVSSVSSGSIVVDVILVLRSRTDATVAILLLHDTPPATMGQEWFGGRVVLAGQPAVVITPGSGAYEDKRWMIDTQAANGLSAGGNPNPNPNPNPTQSGGGSWAFDARSFSLGVGAIGAVGVAIGAVLWFFSRGQPSHNNLRTREVGAITSPLGDSYQASYAPPLRMSKPTSAMEARGAL